MKDKNPWNTDDAAIWQGPAILSNRVYTVNSADRNLIRLAFCEQGGPDKPPIHRVAIALDRFTAQNLAAMLTSILAGEDPIKGQIATGHFNADGTYTRVETKKVHAGRNSRTNKTGRVAPGQRQRRGQK